MEKLIHLLRKIGKRISEAIVTIVLTAMYFMFILPYSLFVKFNRTVVNRNYSYKSDDLDKMF